MGDGEAENFFDGMANLLFELSLEAIDGLVVALGAVGGTIAENEVGKASFERHKMIFEIEVTETN